MIPILKIPKDCLPSFREVWEDYNVRAVVKGSPRVLDIGANVGAFSLMARELWPYCSITAYEPNHDLFPFLHHNVGGFATCVHAAVCSNPYGVVQMVDDGPNRMCGRVVELSSLDPSGAVDRILPRDLPVADIVKIDTEGSEVEIVQGLPFDPLLLMVEYHSEDALVELVSICRSRGMVLRSHKIAREGLGVMHWSLLSPL